MMRKDEGIALVVGLGEVGAPLLRLLARAHEARGQDLGPLAWSGPVDVLHMCLPYEDGGLVKETVRYCRAYSPELVIVHSTVVPGTTRALAAAAGVPVAYSPVRGKHARMEQELMHYTKYVAATQVDARAKSREHLEAAGFTTASFDRPEDLELAKLLETTYFGVLVGWAQEAARYCDAVGADYDEVMRLGDEVPFFPPVVFQPGHIGGHCVIANTHLLDEVRESGLVSWLRASNNECAEGLARTGDSVAGRVEPKPRGHLSEA